MNVGIIGTGLMGYPMAINIAKKFCLKAFNRTFQKMSGLEKDNVKLCYNFKEFCSETDIIITMLPGDDEVLDTLNKIKNLIKPGSIFIDMSSTKVSTAKKCYQDLKLKNINFIDSPVSGGPEGANSASLAIMCGGDEDIFQKCKPLFDTMGKATLVGPSGSGQVAKLCNQIIVGVTIGAVAEAISLCEKNDADPKKFIQAVSGGFADGKILQNHGLRMINKDFSPRGKNITHLKDMQNIIENAEFKNLNLPYSILTRNIFNTLCKNKLDKEDHSSIYKFINNTFED